MTLKLNGVEHDSVSYLANEDMKKSLFSQAQFAVKAGALPPGVSNEYGYMLLVLAGIDLGISPTRAVATLNLIGGKAGMSAQSLLGFAFSRAGVRWTMLETSDQVCRMRFSREGLADHETSFTLDEAKTAGLSPGKPGSGWAKYPRDMLVARTITRGLRYVAADVVAGIYSIEELNDGVASPDFSPAMLKQIDADADLAVLAVGAAVPAGEPQHTTKVSATTALERFGGGTLKEAALDLSQGAHIPLTLKGNLPDVAATSGAIFAVFSQLYNPEMAKSVLSAKVKSLGGDSVSKLTPLDFMTLYRWANGEVEKKQPVAEEEMPESPEHVPAAYDPHLGSATTSATSPVTNGSPEDLDGQIMAIWNDLAQHDKSEPADDIFEKYGYAVGEAKLTQQTRRLVLQELHGLIADAA